MEPKEQSGVDFCDACLTTEGAGRVAMTAVLRAYRSWCKANGRTAQLDPNGLWQLLYRRGAGYEPRFLVGIELIGQPGPAICTPTVVPSVSAWIDECLERDPRPAVYVNGRLMKAAAGEQRRMLMRNYMAYCKDRAIELCSAIAFGRAMKSAGFICRRSMDGAGDAFEGCLLKREWLRTASGRLIKPLDER